MRILGIDPGLATIGLGVVETSSAHDIEVVEWLTITTAGSNRADRLREIHHDLGAFLDECRPELGVVEKLFFAVNVRTWMAVAEARGVILLSLAERMIPIIEPTPLQLKSCITGDGQAEKDRVQDMLVRMLRLKEIPKPDDAADALALAAYGALNQRSLHEMHQITNSKEITKFQ